MAVYQLHDAMRMAVNPPLITLLGASVPVFVRLFLRFPIGLSKD